MKAIKSNELVIGEVYYDVDAEIHSWFPCKFEYMGLRNGEIAMKPLGDNDYIKEDDGVCIFGEPDPYDEWYQA